ncbi:MAG: TIGR01777 family oxidoreductase [Planctomycetaceae bacterium]|nr:TIGR01777 family oxidoreductase [Planctomycetaceae bacterium]
MTVAISGATGLVGQALSLRFQSRGDRVLSITRRDGDGFDDSVRWDPSTGLVNPARLEGIDAVVHLAGENIAGGRWTDSLKKRLRSSRIQGTRSLVESLSKLKHRPRTLVCASAIGYYGDRGDAALTEDASAGNGFLPDLCRDWEAEAIKAEELGMRVVCVRIGIVLSPKGGALAKMMLPFKAGVGGNIGAGDQFWSWIGLNDLARVLEFCVDNQQLTGPVNAVSPNALTNAEFTRNIGAVLHRPTIFPLPAFMAKLVLGEMANELLLASARVVPQKLLKAGFKFEHPELASCLKHELQLKES